MSGDFWSGSLAVCGEHGTGKLSVPVISGVDLSLYVGNMQPGVSRHVVTAVMVQCVCFTCLSHVVGTYSVRIIGRYCFLLKNIFLCTVDSFGCKKL